MIFILLVYVCIRMLYESCDIFVFIENKIENLILKQLKLSINFLIYYYLYDPKLELCAKKKDGAWHCLKLLTDFSKNRH